MRSEFEVGCNEHASHSCCISHDNNNKNFQDDENFEWRKKTMKILSPITPHFNLNCSFQIWKIKLPANLINRKFESPIICLFFHPLYNLTKHNFNLFLFHFSCGWQWKWKIFYFEESDVFHLCVVAWDSQVFIILETSQNSLKKWKSDLNIFSLPTRREHNSLLF
jgi:hypothetical protein